MDTIRTFFPKSGQFFQFSQKGRGGLPSFLSCAPALYRTIDILVETSVSIVLLFVALSIHQSKFVGLPIQQSGAVYLQSYPLQDFLYSDQEACIVSATFLGLLIRWSRDYQNNRITAMTIPVDYSKDFSPITSCLAFLGTIFSLREPVFLNHFYPSDSTGLAI